MLLEDPVRVAEHCNNKVEDQELEQHHLDDDKGVIQVDVLGLLAHQVILSDANVDDGQHGLLEAAEGFDPVIKVEAPGEGKGEAEAGVEDEEVAEVLDHLSHDLDQWAYRAGVLDGLE